MRLTRPPRDSFDAASIRRSLRNRDCLGCRGEHLEPIVAVTRSGPLCLTCFEEQLDRAATDEDLDALVETGGHSAWHAQWRRWVGEDVRREWSLRWSLWRHSWGPPLGFCFAVLAICLIIGHLYGLKPKPAPLPAPAPLVEACLKSYATQEVICVPAAAQTQTVQHLRLDSGDFELRITAR